MAAPLYLTYLIYTYGVNVPYWDQWELVPIFEKLHSGQLTIYDLWNQHNEHRLLFPKLIMLALASITDWDIRYEFYANLVIAGITWFLLCLILQRSFGDNLPPWLLTALSFLIFSPVQWENWTWGWMIQIFLTVSATVAAIWAINRWHDQLKGLIFAIAFAIIASYSFNTGLLTWVILIILSVKQQRRWKQITLLFGASVATTVLYYYNYIKPAHHPSLLYSIIHPCKFTMYVLAYLGLPLGRDRTSSIIIGLFILIVTTAAIIRIRQENKREFDKLLPWIALSLYAFLSACATGVGRAGFGVGQALASRYTTISNLSLISALVIVTLWMQYHLNIQKNMTRRLNTYMRFILIILILAYAANFLHGIKKMARRSEKLQEAALCLSSDIQKVPNESLEILYPNAVIVRHRTKTLHDLRLSIFRDIKNPNLTKNNRQERL